MEGGNLGQTNQNIKCKINTAVGSRKAYPGPNIPMETITHNDLRCHIRHASANLLILQSPTLHQAQQVHTGKEEACVNNS